MFKIMKKNIKNILDEEVISYFKENGFNVFFDKISSSDFKKAFPLGYLKRVRESGMIELVDIQFHSKFANEFAFNFGTHSQIDSVTSFGFDIPIDEITASDLPVFYRLYSQRFLWWWRWFSVKEESNIENVKKEINEAKFQIMNWFQGGDLPKNSVKSGLSS